MSVVDAGMLLTCRKRNMLSGLSCEGRGMGFCAGWRAAIGTTDFSQFFGFRRNFFRDSGII